MSVIEVVYKGERLFITKSDIDRFHKKYEIDEETGCWNWTAYCQPRNGYSKFNLNYRIKYGHISSYLIFNDGEIKENYSVCHTCDNPKCVNPEHLFLGTQKENMKDAILKNKVKDGSSHGLAVLDEETVLEIRIMRAKGFGLVRILNQFPEFKSSTIKNVIYNQNYWKHIKVN